MNSPVLQDNFVFGCSDLFFYLIPIFLSFTNFSVKQVDQRQVFFVCMGRLFFLLDEYFFEQSFYLEIQIYSSSEHLEL